MVLNIIENKNYRPINSKAKEGDLMNLGILNTVIAFVIVLLVLSLLVQSVQMILKKLLKLKSRQIEDLLTDLYEQAISGVSTPPVPLSLKGTLRALIKRFPKLSFLLPGSQPKGGAAPKSAAEVFTIKVLDEFKNIGRYTTFGNAVLDSLSKEDLFKVMGKLESTEFFPDYVVKFQELCDQVDGLRKAIEKLFSDETLRGAASSKIAEMRAILAPVFNDVQTILDGEKVKTTVVFADLLRLGKLNIPGVLSLLEEAQKAVTQEKEIALKANRTQEVDDLDTLSKELTKIASKIGDLSQKFQDAVAPIRKKLEQVEIWFDTVTQSFDERYSRHMRTVAICISIVVVILLNANFFRVYRSLSTNEVQRNLIVENGPAILERSRKAQQPEPSPSPSPSESPSQSPSASPSESPSPSPPPVNIKEEVERTRQEIKALVGSYEDFGFTPISGPQVWSFLWSTGIWTGLWHDDQGKPGWGGFTLARDENGVPVNRANVPIPEGCQEKDKDDKPILKDGKPVDCTPSWRRLSAGEWWASRKHDVVTLIGWTIMVLLLSVGAPFWQDMLESLFGIKNLLRQKSGTQNIETKSGAGQPKQS
jgi:hypothetical protein